MGSSHDMQIANNVTMIYRNMNADFPVSSSLPNNLATFVMHERTKIRLESEKIAVGMM
jgi:hypothetical protein